MASGQDNPGYESSAYTEQIGDWQIADDCFNGNSAITSKGTEYLPQHEKEPHYAYELRLSRSTFWNAYKRTVLGLVGMVFRKSPQLGDDVPPVIAGDKKKKGKGGHVEDIDLQGSHLDVFTKEVFKWAVNDGHSCILVDMPQTVTDQNPEATLADEQAAGLRPYWVLYRKNQIKNWRTDRVGGKVTLTQISLCETVLEPEGEFGETEIEQYRVLTPGHWQIYRKAEKADSQNPEGTWVVVAEGITALTEIPIVIIASNQERYLVSSPPLLDLANENLRHYRLQSDVDNITHYANVPILVEDLGDSTGAVDQLSPDTETADKVISPNSVYRVGKGGSLKYVEPTCTGIKAAQDEIAGSKANMASLGLTLLASQPTMKQTATESVLEYEAETSELAGMARNLEDGIEQSLKLHANYLGLEDGGSVKVNRDFTRVQLDGRTLQQLASMVAADQLPLETLWDMMEQAEMLPPDFNEVEALKQLLAAMQARQALYPSPPQPPKPPKTDVTGGVQTEGEAASGQVQAPS